MLAPCKVRCGCLMHNDRDGSWYCLGLVAGCHDKGALVLQVAQVVRVSSPFSEEVSIVQPEGGSCQDSLKEANMPLTQQEES